MSKPWILAGVVVAVVTLSAEGAWAQRGPRGGGPARGAGGSPAGRGPGDRFGGPNDAAGGFRDGTGRAAGDVAPRTINDIHRGGNNVNINRTVNERANAINVAPTRAVSAHAAALAQPFTPAWYAQHPNAWRATHPHADAFVAATAAGLAAWLAVPAVPVYGYPASAGYVTVEAQPAPAVAPWQEMAAAAPPPADAVAPPAAEPSWMPLGIFSLKAADEGRSTRVIYLAVSPAGDIRGTSTDTLSDSSEDIVGTVDKASLVATWRVGQRGQTVFRARLGDLTLPEADVGVTFADGQTGTWRLTRQEKPAP